MVRRGCYLLLVFGIVSCAAPSYRSEIPLTDQTFQSSDGALKGRVPQGWFVSTDRELVPHLAAWLIRDDYAASLTFQEIMIDQNTERWIEKNGLVLLAEVSFRLKQAEQPTAQMVMPPSEFSIQGKEFCRYEYVSEKDGAPIGVVVFRLRTRFFESVVLPTGNALSQQQLQQLLNVQEAILASIQQ